MKNWAFLIVDDNALDIEYLSTQLRKLPMTHLTACNNIEDIFFLLKEKTFDIIFLDIKFEQSTFNGMDLLHIMPSHTPVIITSSFPEYAIESFNFDNIVDFIEKPPTYERLLRGIKRAVNTTFAQHDKLNESLLYLKTGRKVVKFEVEDILFFKAYGVYSKVHLSNNTIKVVNEPFSTLLNDTLSSKTFRRVQKSYIININKITGYDQKFIYIGNNKIPIGKAYREGLQPLFRLITKRKFGLS